MYNNQYSFQLQLLTLHKHLEIMSTFKNTLILYPQILETKCIVISGYKYRNQHGALCLRCFARSFMPSNADFGIFHGFFYGPINPLSCSLCNKTLAVIEPMVACLPCFLAYKGVFNKLKLEGINIQQVDRVIYSHCTDRLLKLHIAGQ